MPSSGRRRGAAAHGMWWPHTGLLQLRRKKGTVDRRHRACDGDSMSPSPVMSRLLVVVVVALMAACSGQSERATSEPATTQRGAQNAAQRAPQDVVSEEEPLPPPVYELTLPEEMR